MPAQTRQAERRAWAVAERRAARLERLGAASESPSLGRVFMDGFMNASLLELGVCSPSREAPMTHQAEPTRRYAAVYVTEWGGKSQQRKAAKAQQPAALGAR